MALTQVDQGMLGTYAQYTGFKNRIINGQMAISQRGTSFVSPTDAYTIDRWEMQESTDGTVTVTQETDAPTGFSFSQKFTVTSADASLAATQALTVGQYIEGFNTADLVFGSASAATITLSFWVKSSLTGTFGGALQNSARTRSYPFTYTISSASTWEQKTVTIAGDTSGTWIGATNGIGLRVYFGLGVGSTYSGTAGAWAATNYYSATGAISVIGTNSATWAVTGVQLEKGSTATSFDYRSYGQELLLCQRYYQRLYVENCISVRPQSAGTGSSQAYIPFLVQTRSTATIAFPQSSYNPNLGTPTAATSGTYPQNATNGVRVYSSTNATQNDTANLTCEMTVSAEL
jgi:hypothetical protein